ncbi:hypothetical protein CR513_09843, partial [Mucuna pruriens]
MEEEARLIRKQQRRLNLTILDVVKKEVMRLLSVEIIYPISDSQWVSPVQVVPKNFGMTVIKNQHDELMPMRIQNSWRVCIDYKKLNQGCMKVFMDDFMVYAESFDACLENLSRVLTRCIDTNLVLNFEKCHFMVTEGIVLGHLIQQRHQALRFLLKKPDVKPRLIWWMLLLQEFDIKIKDKIGVENSIANHLSRIERENDPMSIRDDFLD